MTPTQLDYWMAKFFHSDGSTFIATGNTYEEISAYVKSRLHETGISQIIISHQIEMYSDGL